MFIHDFFFYVQRTVHSKAVWEFKKIQLKKQIWVSQGVTCFGIKCKTMVARFRHLRCFHISTAKRRQCLAISSANATHKNEMTSLVLELKICRPLVTSITDTSRKYHFLLSPIGKIPKRYSTGDFKKYFIIFLVIFIIYLSQQMNRPQPLWIKRGREIINRRNQNSNPLELPN